MDCRPKKYLRALYFFEREYFVVLFSLWYFQEKFLKTGTFKEKLSLIDWTKINNLK